MIEKTILLRCDVPRAFELFTQRLGEWWPPERRHTGDASSEIAMLPTGRFYERAHDGREVELGRVRTWEAPHRLVLDWYPGTDAAHPTRVEVRFVPEDGGTRVQLTHGPLPESEALFPQRAPRYVASWDLVLPALERAAGPGGLAGR